MRKILLQCKYLLVEWLNVTYQLVPNPLRSDYLRLFGIRLGGDFYTQKMQILSCRQVIGREQYSD